MAEKDSAIADFLTKLQTAVVMLDSGTPEQQLEALKFVVELHNKPVNNEVTTPLKLYTITGRKTRIVAAKNKEDADRYLRGIFPYVYKGYTASSFQEFTLTEGMVLTLARE